MRIVPLDELIASESRLIGPAVEDLTVLDDIHCDFVHVLVTIAGGIPGLWVF